MNFLFATLSIRVGMDLLAPASLGMLATPSIERPAKYRVQRRLSAVRSLIPLAAFFAWAPAVPALDPVKAISQYCHAVWRTADGLPQDAVVTRFVFTC